jgi:hypothetical protein
VSADPATVGEIVLANLARGRERAIEQARERGANTERAIRRELDIDILNHGDARGRAGRITRRLARYGLRLSERHVKRILDVLSSASDSSMSNQISNQPED